jgi:hypothetical protein
MRRRRQPRLERPAEFVRCFHSPERDRRLINEEPVRGRRRVAILFAGGPAPAANAVISTAAVSFLRKEIQVVGVLYGYANLVEYSAEHPMLVGRDYLVIDHKTLRRTRNTAGVLIGTSRTNPGKHVSQRADFDRRRRHAQDGQQAQALPGPPARGRPANPDRARSQDDRQRLSRH